MKSDLQYFRTGMLKRFSDCSEKQVDQAIERALEEIKPSRDRTRLNRIVIAILNEECGEAA